MKVLIPTWQGRISPVFDVAGEAMVAHVPATAATCESVILTEETPVRRAQRLRGWGVQVLVCSAISAPFRAALQAAGIRVVAHVCGPVEEVIQAFHEERLDDDKYMMPGCHCPRRGRRRACCGQPHADQT